MQLLRTLLIILMILFGMRILARLFGPFLVKYASKKVEKKFRERFEKQYGGRNPDSNYKEGETIVEPDKTTRNSKNSSEKVGEYIEFEEID
ncbi:DUF4834 family protein [Robertkochia flava]|uniref:DUF4834 family protein n=1 Tax=Robertkochia flava TaxID=3447986 RepID=UPI001CCAA12A|nr:DUF4834 family protein [Robertkochia marina]